MLKTRMHINTLTEISLSRFKLWTIEGDRRGDVISCLMGTLWITQKNDLRDYVLEAGQEFWVTRPGNVVVQALENSRFKYSLNELPSQIEPDTQPIHFAHYPHMTSHLR
jgi:Protein of unknown function (DUF2917)